MGEWVKTTDDTLVLFRQRDLQSEPVCQLPEATEVELGETSEFGGRQWMEASLADGARGYALGPSVLGHTTAGLNYRRRDEVEESIERPVEPRFTTVSLLLTIVIELAIVADMAYRAEAWGGLAQVTFLAVGPLVGLFINGFLGSAGASRGERGAWPTALLGSALWFLTILAFYLIRGHLLRD